MSSAVVPRQPRKVAPSDADNRFKGVQHKLKTLSQSLDSTTGELEVLSRAMRANAERAEQVAVEIADADLDKRFVELTSAVSVALGGAAVELGKLNQTGQDLAARAHETSRLHARLYEALDELRSSRRETTPKPGFFIRK
ncbi:conjugal transfer protein TraB [Streptomyces goshikiensis]